LPFTTLENTWLHPFHCNSESYNEEKEKKERKYGPIPSEGSQIYVYNFHEHHVAGYKYCIRWKWSFFCLSLSWAMHGSGSVIWGDLSTFCRGDCLSCLFVC
jgi:hypothetical protein